MSDNQSWNSSGSEEDLEPREESGHPVGIAEFSGVLSKVSQSRLLGQCHCQVLRASLPACISGRNEAIW